MPPKPAAKPAGKAEVQLETKSFIIEINVSIDESCDDPPQNIRVRLVCEWMDCCLLSEVFGTDSQPWNETTDPNVDSSAITSSDHKKLGSLKVDFEPDLSSSDSKNTFNRNPSIYAVMFMQREENSIMRDVPVVFAMADCSSIGLHAGSIIVSSELYKGSTIEVKISSSKPLLGLGETIVLEPFVLNVGRITSYPRNADETYSQALNGVYLYGRVEFGGYSRILFSRPQINISAKGDDDDDKDVAQFNYISCIFPGLVSIPDFKDMLMATTCGLEIHREDLCKRVFHTRNVEEFWALQSLHGEAAEGGANSQNSSAVVAKGKKAAPSAKGSSAAAPGGAPTSRPANACDMFLLDCIWRALSGSSLINPHGSARFRLEQLLSSSMDLLKEFSRRHHNIVDDGDDKVVVEEEMLLEVRLQKPSQPIRWRMPTDFSLRDALQQKQAEERSRLDGTLAIRVSPGDTVVAAGGQPTGSSMGSSTGGFKQKIAKASPRHERFIECGTTVELIAQLHRSLEHPRLPPPVLQSRVPNLPTIADSHHISPPSAVGTAGNELSDAQKDLSKRLSETPFARMVFVFKYSDDDTLLAINEAIDRVNSRALPDIQGSLRSYSFTPEELESSTNATLDVITGFMVIDDDLRTVVIEGLAGPGQGMQSVFMDLPRQKADDKDLKILCNPEILFPQRIYPSFGPDLKRIRVREKLKKLARRPELYNRKQVEEVTFAAVDKLMTLRRATDLRSTKVLDMYPPADSLGMLELLYGDALSRTDLDGAEAEAERARLLKVKADNLKNSRPGTSPEEGAGPPAPEASLSSPQRRQPRSQSHTTVCQNPDYEVVLRASRKLTKDFLGEQRELRKQAWESMLQRTQERDTHAAETLRATFGKDPSECKIFMYSMQKLNFKVAAFDEMRRQLAKTKNFTYTYSANFGSQTVSVAGVDEDHSSNARKKNWLTPSGFVYPRTRTRKELLTHPKRPVDAKITELAVPWDEPAPRYMSDKPSDAHILSQERGFNSQFRAQEYFGFLEPVEFTRPFELKLVGDKTKLPRGNLIAGESSDPAFFRSVHLGGAESLRLVDEARAKEKADWQAKVVVDDTAFKVGGFSVRDKPIMVDRASDILKSEPAAHALKHLRTTKSHKGSDLSYQTAPVSILMTEEFGGGKHKLKGILARRTDETQFVTARGPTLQLTKPIGGRPKDFQTYVNQHSAEPPLLRAVHKKHHPPLDKTSIECSGPRWDRPDSLP